MTPLDDARILDVWDRGQAADPIERALVLLSESRPELSRDALLDMALDARDAAILALREATYGRALSGWTTCPACAERLTVELDARDNADLLAPSFTDAAARAPTSRDLFSLGDARDAADAAERLARSLGAEVAIEDRPERSLRFSCAACAAGWSEDFDVAAYCWEEIDQHARRLIDDVDVLAHAYGWGESEILSLSPARRAAYLDRRLA